MLNILHIIIVTYNAMPWLDKCLGSIDFSKHKVVIVDNNSSDKTTSYIQSKYNEITLLEQNKNLGFGAANNIGISYALKQGAEHVFLLNQDAYLVDDVIENLKNFQTKNREYGILSPIHVNADKTKLDRNFSNYIRYDFNSSFYSDFVLGNKIKPVYDVPFVNAAGWLISKECLLKVGGFDPIFHHYGEDDNYCQRVKYHGFKIGVCPNSYIIHDRENREKPYVVPFSDEYFHIELRSFKVRHANVNNNNMLEIEKYKKRMNKKLLKAYLKIDRLQIKGLKNYINSVKETIPQIETSLKLNKKAQPNYLDI